MEYFYIQHETDRDLQLGDGLHRILIFSTQADALARMQKVGLGGEIIGPVSRQTLIDRFRAHRLIVFVTGDRESMLTMRELFSGTV